MARIEPAAGHEADVARRLIESAVDYDVDTTGPRLAYLVSDADADVLAGKDPAEDPEDEQEPEEPVVEEPKPEPAKRKRATATK